MLYACSVHYIVSSKYCFGIEIGASVAEIASFDLCYFLATGVFTEQRIKYYSNYLGLLRLPSASDLMKIDTPLCPISQTFAGFASHVCESLSFTEGITLVAVVKLSARNTSSMFEKLCWPFVKSDRRGRTTIITTY